MNDKSKAFANAETRWNNLVSSYRYSPEISGKLKQIQSLVIHYQFNTAEDEWRKLKGTGFLGSTDTYNGFWTAFIENQREALPREAQQKKPSIGRRRGVDMSKMIMTKDQMFNKSIENLKRELEYNIRFTPTQPIDPKLFEKCVQATVIAEFVNPKSEEYKAAKNAAFAKWCTGKTEKEIHEQRRGYETSKQFSQDTNHIFLYGDGLRIKGNQKWAAAVEDIIKRKDFTAKDFKKDSLYNKLLSPLSQGRIEIDETHEEKKLGRTKKIKTTQRLAVSPAAQKEIADFLSSAFQVRCYDYAQNQKEKKVNISQFFSRNQVALQPIAPQKKDTFVKKTIKAFSKQPIPVSRPQKQTFSWTLFSKNQNSFPQKTDLYSRINNLSARASRVFRKKPKPSQANPLSPLSAMKKMFTSPSQLLSLATKSPVVLAVLIPVLITLFILFTNEGTGLTIGLGSLSGDSASSSERNNPVIAIEKRADQNSISLNDDVAYTINAHYSNITGPIVITDPIPNNATYVPNSCSPSDQCQLTKDANGKDAIQWTINASPAQSSNQGAPQATDNTALVAWLNKKLSEDSSKNGLAGMGQTIVSLSLQHDIPIELALGQFMLESHWYTDTAGISKDVGEHTNNPGDIMCTNGLILGAIANNVCIEKTNQCLCTFSSLEKGIEAYFVTLDSTKERASSDGTTSTYRDAVNNFILTSDPRPIIRIYFRTAPGYATEDEYVETVNRVTSDLRGSASKDGITLPFYSASSSTAVSGTASLVFKLTASANNSYIVNQAFSSLSQSNCSIVKVGSPPEKDLVLPAQCPNYIGIKGITCPTDMQANTAHSGYYLLPKSPSGAYKSYVCKNHSWGTKELICAIHTVAERWKQKYPSGYLSVGDLNGLDKAVVGSGNGGHATHLWGRGVDIDATTNGKDCAGDYAGTINAAGITCTRSNYNYQATVEFGKMLIDTGLIRNIFFDDENADVEMNNYAKSIGKPLNKCYPIGGHANHFHVDLEVPLLEYWGPGC
jgi:hypothetical protein